MAKDDLIKEINSKDLDPQTKEKALAAIERIADKNEAYYLDEETTLFAAFDWRRTTEGSEFWNDISNASPLAPSSPEGKKEEYQTIRVPQDCIPKGATLVEAYENEKEIVVCGMPEDEPEEHDDSWYEIGHNCDAMGCGTLSHVIYRFDKNVNESHQSMKDENERLKEQRDVLLKALRSIPYRYLEDMDAHTPAASDRIREAIEFALSGLATKEGEGGEGKND